MADETTPPHRPSDTLYERLARDAARLLVMHEAGRVLRSTHDAQELSRELLSAIAEALYCRSGCVARLRDDELEMLATLGFDEAQADELSQHEAEAAIWFHVSESEDPLSREELIELDFGDDGSEVEEGRRAPFFDAYIPLRLEDRQIGVVGLGQRADGEPFTTGDRELAVSLSSQLALALNSSELFEEKEKHIEQLSVLLRLSKELTSTLEIEKVLGTVAGMLGLIVPNRRTVVALVHGESVRIRASSDEDFDAKQAKSDPLYSTLLWAHGSRQEVNTSKSELEADEEADGRDVLLPLFESEGGPRALAIRLLKDDEGVLGYLAIESDTDEPPLDADTEELLTLLVNQTSVAIRNAELYQRIPMLSAFAGKKRGAGGRKWIKRGILAALIALGLLLPLPSWISGDATVRPTMVVPVRAATEGTVESIEVAEGDVVTAGGQLAAMRRDEIEMQLEQTRSAVRRAQAEAGQARQAGNLAVYRARQAELVRFEEERRFLELELARKDLVAPVSGVVLTPHVDLLRGLHLARGDIFVEMADLARMEIEIAVPEHEIDNTSLGAEARFKVQAFPGRIFGGEVVRISPRADDTGMFQVTVGVPNEDGALRPGMTGRAHIDVPWRPFLYKPLRPLVAWFRLKFWV